MTYKLRFWGVRGTVPTSSANQLRHGGNTSCLAADLGEAGYLVLDCGTGLKVLGNHLRAGGVRRYHVFLSHYHLDHIIGIPFFHPLYDKNSSIIFHGFSRNGNSVREVLERLMSPPYFPVELSKVPAKVEYDTTDGSSRRVADVTISPLDLNHPNGCHAYRLEHSDHRLVYATDHEHGVAETDEALIRFASGADYLIYDAMYQEREYEHLRRGWGHSTWYAAIRIARAAKVRNLVLFHHNPDHTDDELEEILRLARGEFPASQMASEGLELEF